MASSGVTAVRGTGDADKTATTRASTMFAMPITARAALAIRRDLFLSIGGFDSYYAPAYYEDTDLAFQVRARGLRVLYQPAAEIFHLEGVSHGRDETSGIKAHQVTNAGKFHERWKDTLANHRDNAVEPEQEAHRGTRSNILTLRRA